MQMWLSVRHTLENRMQGQVCCSYVASGDITVLADDELVTDILFRAVKCGMTIFAVFSGNDVFRASKRTDRRIL